MLNLCSSGYESKDNLLGADWKLWADLKVQPLLGFNDKNINVNDMKRFKSLLIRCNQKVRVTTCGGTT